MKRPSLRDEIVRLYEQERLTVSEIARRLGCSKANVSTTLKRALSWDHRITPLPKHTLMWLMRNSVRLDKSPAALARDIIIKYYTNPKEEK